MYEYVNVCFRCGDAGVCGCCQDGPVVSNFTLSNVATRILPDVSWFLSAAPWPSGSEEAKASGDTGEIFGYNWINSH